MHVSEKIYEKIKLKFYLPQNKNIHGRWDTICLPQQRSNLIGQQKIQKVAYSTIPNKIGG